MLKISKAVLKWSTSIIIGSTFWGLNLLYPSTARAWFDVCNKSGDKASVAFAYLEIDAAESDIFGNTPPRRSRGWTTEGWWNLTSGECARVYPHELNKRNGIYYVYAEAEDGGEWSGKNRFCTINKPFTLARADKQCEGIGRVWKNFIEVNTGNARNYTYNLGD